MNVSNECGSPTPTHTSWAPCQRWCRCSIPGGPSNPLGSIDRLKKRLQADLHYEWFVTTDISALPGRPRAVIHCPFANRMTDCLVHYPATGTSEPRQQEGNAAIEGRIQGIKITSLESSLTWQFVGVYPSQYVAASTNRTARPASAAVLTALDNLVSKAREDGHRIAILGDFNAALPEGRWGYSKWSAAVTLSL